MGSETFSDVKHVMRLRTRKCGFKGYNVNSDRGTGIHIVPEGLLLSTLTIMFCSSCSIAFVVRLVTFRSEKTCGRPCLKFEQVGRSQMRITPKYQSPQPPLYQLFSFIFSEMKIHGTSSTPFCYTFSLPPIRNVKGTAAGNEYQWQHHVIWVLCRKQRFLMRKFGCFVASELSPAPRIKSNDTCLFHSHSHYALYIKFLL